MEKTCICLMNDSFPPMIDGVATAVSQYARFITQNHGQTVVATPEYPGVTDDYPFPVVRYPSVNTTKLVGYRTGVPFHAQSVRELSGYPIDLIHSHCPLVSTYLARTVRQTKNVPLVLTYHTKFDIDIAKAVRSGQLQSAAIRLLIDNVSACDEVWVVSKGAGDNLHGLGYQGDCYLMENGVDFPRGKASPAAVNALRERLHADYNIDTEDGAPLFLFVGRMMWYKGIRLILDALRTLSDANLPYHMIFIGDGMDFAEIKAYTEELRLTDRCVFTGAIRDRELLRAYYSIGTLFLFPSTFDTNGIVVREAAACGLPSMLIAGSCAAEGITDGRTGFLVEENAPSIAALLKKVCEDKSRCAAVGECAMREIYLSWEDAVARAWERYQIVIERNRSGAVRKPEPLSDEIFIGIADVLDKVNKMHAVRSDIEALTEEILQKGTALREESAEKLEQQYRAIAAKAEAYRAESAQFLSEHRDRAADRTKKLYEEAAEWFEQENAEFRERYHEIHDRLWDLLDRYL